LISKYSLLIFIFLFLLIISQLLVIYPVKAKNVSWFWFRVNSYAKYVSNYTVNALYDCSSNLNYGKTLRGDVIIYWKIIDANETHFKVFFNITFYNISYAKEFMYINGKYRYKKLDINRLVRTCTLTVRLKDRLIYYDGKCIGEWAWFIHTWEIGNISITLAKGFKPYESNIPKETFISQGTVIPLSRLNITNFNINLDYIVLPASRLAVLAFPLGKSGPSPIIGCKIYYDMITGVIVRIDLWDITFGRITPGIYTDNLLYHVLNITEIDGAITKKIDKKVIYMPISLILVETNIPLERPIFGEMKKQQPNKLYLLLPVILAISTYVLYRILRKAR